MVGEVLGVVGAVGVVLVEVAVAAASAVAMVAARVLAAAPGRSGTRWPLRRSWRPAAGI